HRPGLAGQHDPTHDRHRSRHQAPLDQAQRRFLTQGRLRVAQALTTDMNGAFGSVDLLRQGKFSSSHGPGSVEFAEVPLELLGGVRTGSPGKVPERKVLKVAGKDNFRVRPCARSHKATVASPLTSMTKAHAQGQAKPHSIAPLYTPNRRVNQAAHKTRAERKASATICAKARPARRTSSVKRCKRWCTTSRTSS